MVPVVYGTRSRLVTPGFDFLPFIYCVIREDERYDANAINEHIALPNVYNNIKIL